MATASTPLSSRYSWMASTSAFFSANISTCWYERRRVSDFSHVLVTHFALSIVTVLTGGGVFWRHSSRYTILASSLTYSTSCTHTKYLLFSLQQFYMSGFKKCNEFPNLDGKHLSVTNKHTWMTSKLAAPALPTLMVMGLTSALLAKFWIFLGIVALKSSVCLCPWVKK